MNKIRYCVDDDLSAEAFLGLVQAVWPGAYDQKLIGQALKKTLNVTAWDGSTLVGSCRILTDGYLFSTIPEILVHPECQRQGIGRKLMELAWTNSPTSLFFGAQPGNEPFFERLGCKPGPKSYVLKKPRSTRPPGESVEQ